MIIFTIPFISKQVSKNWDLAVTLLQGTLDSLDNQSSRNFRVIVGCHEIPPVQLRQNPQALSFVQMDYSPLDKPYCDEYYLDRAAKCCVPLLKVRETDFKYCMAIDADDRVRQDLVEFLEKQDLVDVWLINKGYQVDYPSSRVFYCEHLNDICGSTVVLSPAAAGLAQPFNGNSADDLKQCFWSACSHDQAREFLEERGFSIKEMPFPSVQYILNHQINVSQTFRKNKLIAQTKRVCKFWVVGHRMSSKECKEFGYASHF